MYLIKKRICRKTPETMPPRRGTRPIRPTLPCGTDAKARSGNSCIILPQMAGSCKRIVRTVDFAPLTP